MISPYKAMWLVVAFDLPTLTKEDRRRANNFRTDLIKLGFIRLQLSLYYYYSTTKEKAEYLSHNIKSLTPKKGHVVVMFLTDRQFGMTKNYFGGIKNKLEPPELGLLFE